MSIEKHALQAVAPPGMPWAMPGTSHIHWMATNQPQLLWAERTPNWSMWLLGRLGRLDESLSRPWQAPVRRCNEMQWDPFTLMNIDDFFCAQRNAKHYSLSLKSLAQMQSDSVKPQSAAMNWRHLFFMFSCLCQKVCCNPILSVKPSIEIIRVV